MHRVYFENIYPVCVFGHGTSAVAGRNVEISIESLDYASALRTRLQDNHGDVQKLDFILEDWMSPVAGGYKWLNILHCAAQGLLDQGAFDRLKYAPF